MNDNKIVKIEDLKSAASDIIKKKDMIMNIYETNIKKIMYELENFIEELGYNYNDLNKQYKDLFSKFELSTTELTDLLTKKIIPNYEELVLNINKTFNKNFADNMTNILNLEDNDDE